MQLRHEVDHLLPSIVMVKNEWSHTFAPLYAFMVWAGKILMSFIRLLLPFSLLSREY
jgi:hypothetical protein